MHLIRMCLIAGLATGLAACEPRSEPAKPAAPSVVASAAVLMPAGVRVSSPLPAARVVSPLVVTGVAPSDWYSEAQFEAELLAADGTVLAQAPARAQGEDWMTRGSAPFTATFDYVSPTAQTAIIVLTEDQTGENLPPPRTVRIPVMLSPAG